MFLEKSQCDSLQEIQTLILRECNIQYFEKSAACNFDELINLECLFASHNMIKDLYGVGSLSTLVELNLSFNRITDVTPLEELVRLEKLFLSRNQISVIDTLGGLTKLKVLSLYSN